MRSLIKKLLVLSMLTVTLFLGLKSIPAVSAETTTTTTTETPVPPTGYAGGDDTSLYTDNMLMNSSFDMPLFAKNYSNDVWYYLNSASGVKAGLVYDYAQSGESCVRLSGRTSSYSELQSRSIMIFTQQVYRLSGYVSSLLPTKGNLSIRAWGFWDFYQDVNEPQRYMNVTHYGEVEDFKEIGPNSWQYFEMDFSWKYDVDAKNLVISIYDKTTGEVTKTLTTTECTDLSVFEFSFMTDPADENSLTDLYFDSYYLRNVNNEYHEEDDNDDDLTTTTEPDEDPIIIIDDDQTPDDNNSNGSVWIYIASAVVGIVVVAGGIVFFVSKKKKK